MSTNLPFGKTPWDDMPRDELLVEMKRFYSALNDSRCALNILRGEEVVGYWGLRGTGGTAMAKADEAMAPYEDMAEDLYKAYFRYADDLLFKAPVGFQFGVCLNCKKSFGNYDHDPPRVPGRCTNCGGPMRALCWDDMKSKEAHV